MTTTITIEKAGRRYYISGATYGIKDQLRAAGCKWDPERKAWWTSKQDVAERFAGEAPAAAKPAKEDLARRRVSGKVEYKGRSYYVIGRSERTHKLWLTVLDCSIDFWAAEDLCRWVKTYPSRDQTLAAIQRFVAGERRNREAGGEVCAECGRSGKLVHDLEDGQRKHRHCCDIEPM